MENMKKILFVLVLFFFSLNISYAECDFTENNKNNINNYMHICYMYQMS